MALTTVEAGPALHLLLQAVQGATTQKEGVSSGNWGQGELEPCYAGSLLMGWNSAWGHPCPS